jgi:hypothetical protein
LAGRVTFIYLTLILTLYHSHRENFIHGCLVLSFVGAKVTLPKPTLNLFISWMLADARRSLYGCFGCQKVTLVTVDAKVTFSWMPWMPPGRFVGARAKMMDVGCQKHHPDMELVWIHLVSLLSAIDNLISELFHVFIIRKFTTKIFCSVLNRALMFLRLIKFISCCWKG